MLLRFYSTILFSCSILFSACQKNGIPGSPDIKPPVNDTVKQNSILWGSTIWRNPNEDYPAALTRVKKAFGTHDIIRTYIMEKFPVWPGWLLKESNVQISFKMNPDDILSGTKDQELKSFFNSLASSAKIFWTYHHEPEDEIEAGEFTAKQYRDAFDHLINLQKKVNKPNLISTLCLMAYSLETQSNRKWRDYLPKNVEVISWDGYYRDYMGTDIGAVFRAARDSTAKIGKLWAIGETGVNKSKKSGRVNEDMPEETRKLFLKALALDIKTVKPYPVFVCYFDSAPSHDATYSDWRISPYPDMIQAWNEGRE